jgi:hypothetical protein
MPLQYTLSVQNHIESNLPPTNPKCIKYCFLLPICTQYLITTKWKHVFTNVYKYIENEINTYIQKYSGFAYFSHNRCWQVYNHWVHSHAISIDTLAVEWPYWRAQWPSTWHHHRMPPFQQVSSSNFWSTVSVVIVKRKRLEATTAQPGNGRPQAYRPRPLNAEARSMKKKMCVKPS